MRPRLRGPQVARGQHAAAHGLGRDPALLVRGLDIEEAEALCERIAIICDGRVMAEGTAPDLTARFGGDGLEEAYLRAMR